MIAVRLGGGIGNQLFQYAAGRALALRRGVGLACDNRGYRWRDPRRQALRQFAIRTVRPDVPLPEIGKGLFARWRKVASPLRIVREHSIVFDPGILDLPDGCYLEGYFPSERYFAGAEEALRSEIVPVRRPDARNRDALERIRRTLAVSLHVRRGDYVTHRRTSETFGTLGADYYNRAMEHIASACGEPLSLFVFSDDIGWARANIRSRFPTEFVSHNGAGRPAQDLMLMSACRHHIIANSSFSWWGAWLNPSREKIVVAPRRWFVSGGFDDSTMVPEAWVRL